MSKQPRGVMLTVTGMEALERRDGRVAIMIETRERGSVAFEVNLAVLKALRQTVIKAENRLRSFQSEG